MRHYWTITTHDYEVPIWECNTCGERAMSLIEPFPADGIMKFVRRGMIVEVLHDDDLRVILADCDEDRARRVLES